jgi:anti-anti-sigma factor
MGSPVQRVRDLWTAYEAGGLDAFIEAAGDDVVWQPYVGNGRVFRTSRDLRAALLELDERGVTYEPRLHDLEQHGNVVLAHGVLRVSAEGGTEDHDVHWAYHFREGKLARQTTHASRAEALEALMALRMLEGQPFELAETEGAGGERVVALRGELDIASAPDLERTLLRSRPAGQRVVVDLAGLRFMDSTGLRVLLRARVASEKGRWELRMTNVPPNIRRLFDMTGVHDALPAELGD